MKKQSQAAIGRALGLSPASMTKLKAMGMPVDSSHSAKVWRENNIRLMVHTAAPRRDSVPMPPASSGAVENAHAWMNIAAAALASGQRIAAMVPRLRIVLANVPVREREAVLVHSDVMDILTADVAAVLTADSDSSDGAVPMSDDEQQYMGHFWYKVAAGEIQVSDFAP
jgi:hypothetical protein